MAMFGQPSGMLAAAGATGGGFGQSLAGVMNAFSADSQNSQNQADRELEQIIQIRRLESQITAAEQAKAEQKRAIGQKLAQQGQAEELRGQIPGHLQELFDVDQKTAIARAFPEAPKPGAQYRTVGSDLFDVSGDKPKLAARGRRNDEPLEQVYDPETGRITLVPRSQAAGRQVAPKGGITIGPDGTVQIGGDPTSLTRTTRQNLEEGIVNAKEGTARLDEIDKAFNSDFLTYKGVAQAEALKHAEKLGVPIGGEQEQYLSDFTSLRQATGENLSRYIKEISGAAASDTERKALGENLPAPNDSPTQFRTKLENKRAQLKAVEARLSYLRTNGIDPGKDFGGIGLNEVPDLIQARGEQLEQEAAAAGVPPDQIPIMVSEQLKHEFGL